MGTDYWLNAGKKRFIYQEFIAGTGGDIFSSLAGSTSKGTIGVGKKGIDKKQIRPIAGGINLPNKTMISSIQHYAKKYPEKPVLEKTNGRDPKIAILNQDKAVNKKACCKFSFF